MFDFGHTWLCYLSRTYLFNKPAYDIYTSWLFYQLHRSHWPVHGVVLCRAYDCSNRVALLSLNTVSSSTYLFWKKLFFGTKNFAKTSHWFSYLCLRVDVLASQSFVMIHSGMIQDDNWYWQCNNDTVPRNHR